MHEDLFPDNYKAQYNFHISSRIMVTMTIILRFVKITKISTVCPPKIFFKNARFFGIAHLTKRIFYAILLLSVAALLISRCYTL